MKKKALLLMLFIMFISTNALSQVSCGVAAAIDQDCLDRAEEICEARRALRSASCPLEKEECEDIARFKKQQCDNNVDQKERLCVFLSGAAFQSCMLDVMYAEDACSSAARSDENACYWVELHCNYEALDSYYECQEQALIDCEEEL